MNVSLSSPLSKVKVTSTKCILKSVRPKSPYQILAAPGSMVAMSLCTMLSVMASPYQTVILISPCIVVVKAPYTMLSVKEA